MDELSKRAAELQGRHQLSLHELVTCVRPLVSVLRDAQRENSAKELEAALFLHDAVLQEMNDFAMANLGEVLKRALNERGGPR